MSTPRCHWDTDLGWLTPEHRADCKDQCDGCRPCPKTHCALRGRCPTHVEVAAGIITCPGCVGKVRTKLHKIEDRSTELGEEAEESGIDSEAANLCGPAADPFVWERRWRRKEVMDRTDPFHPYAVLGRWDMLIREDYKHPTELSVSVSRARAYLDGMLNTIANDDEQDFELFDREISRCLAHLEAALSDSRIPEKGAPCPQCREAGTEAAPRLAKHWSHEQENAGYTEGNEERAWTEDRWQCPDVKTHHWTEAEYRLRVSADYLAHASALTADQMHKQWGIKPGTLRAWASLGKVHKRGLNQNGLITYGVAEAKAEHAKTRAEVA